MRIETISARCRSFLVVAAGAVVLASCATAPPACGGPQSRSLSIAVDEVKANLIGGCIARFDSYYDDLLSIAEGDPKIENKRVFSEFLVWSSDQGLLSQRQARDYYNRYFNVKFTSMQGDYNNCSHTCPRRERAMMDLERELVDKERGLLRVSQDSAGYYRSDELYQEIELVLEATCTACDAGR